MTILPHTPPGDRLQPIMLAVLPLVTIGFTGILSLSPGNFFQPYFGPLHPLFAVVLISVLGVASLRILSSRGWFAIFRSRESLRGVLLSTTVATLFAVAVIAVDLHIAFLYRHVPPPESLLFYPAMAYVAEIVFHTLPLSLLLIALPSLFKALDSNRLIWWCIHFVSLLEPIFQLVGEFSKGSFSWTDAYVGLHVLAFNLLQLYVFRRYDFLSMYAFRLVYYIEWHIAWGAVRPYVLS